MTKHTPGPWGSQDNPVLVRGCNFLSHAHYETELGRANARLIAAAPDLLAACVEFVRKVDAGEARSTKSAAQMRAAIAKATAA